MNETGAVFMMGQNPNLPVMPEKPRLLDFFHYRFNDIAFRHLLQSAKTALDAGQSETVVIACLLHDISNGAFLRSDHGYWGAQMIAPYVSEEVAWAVQYHQALRYFADEAVGLQVSGCLQPVLRAGLQAGRIPVQGARGGAQPPLVHDLAADHHLRHLLLRGRRGQSTRRSSPTSSAATSASRRKGWASTARRSRTCGAR